MTVSTTPSWATRHNYLWHSNPRSNDLAKALFDKCIVRPKVQAAWQVIKHFKYRYAEAVGETQAETVALNRDLFCSLGIFDGEIDGQRWSDAWDTINRYEHSTLKMRCGTNVQWAADRVLLPEQEDGTEQLSEELAAKQMVERIRAIQPLFWQDKVAHVEEREHRIEEAPAVLKHALAGLREATAGINALCGETQLFDRIPGSSLQLPYNTKPDYANRIDLKTSWDTATGTTKTGWKRAKLNKSIQSHHLSQIAGFFALNGGIIPKVVYATRHGYTVLEPAEALLRHTLNEISSDLKIRENLLRAADSPHQLLQITPPNWNHFWSWKGMSPLVLAEARALWGLDH